MNLHFQSKSVTTNKKNVVFNNPIKNLVMIFDQKLSKQRSNSLIKEHDVTTVKKSSNGQNLSILWKETTSSDGLLDYNLISVLESHRLMGIGNSN